MSKILVIDDDRELCKLLAEYLKPEGFEVEEAYNGDSGIDMLLGKKFYLVILDIMLPGGQNGFDILKRLRNLTVIPVIMLTARGDEVDRIVGLEMGADDYIPKPFNPRELLARIHAVLRRSTRSGYGGTGKEESKLTVGDIELDYKSRSVYKSSKPVRLTGVELDFLEILLRNCGEVVSREDLSNKILERPLLPYDRSVDVHVSNIRKKLGAANDGSERIRSIRGTGYVYLYPDDSQKIKVGKSSEEDTADAEA